MPHFLLTVSFRRGRKNGRKLRHSSFIIHLPTLASSSLSLSLSFPSSTTMTTTTTMVKGAEACGPTFPRKLFDTLERAADAGLGSIFSWKTCGTKFAIQDKSRFVSEVLNGGYFELMRKWEPFMNQVREWGFVRDGGQRGKPPFVYFHHEGHFRRDGEENLQLIARERAPGDPTTTISNTVPLPMPLRDKTNNKPAAKSSCRCRSEFHSLPGKSTLEISQHLSIGNRIVSSSFQSMKHCFFVTTPTSMIIAHTCGIDQLKQPLPHFGTNDTEELRDYLEVVHLSPLKRDTTDVSAATSWEITTQATRLRW
jgi:hypothetical protein